MVTYLNTSNWTTINWEGPVNTRDAYLVDSNRWIMTNGTEIQIYTLHPNGSFVDMQFPHMTFDPETMTEIDKMAEEDKGPIEIQDLFKLLSSKHANN